MSEENTNIKKVIDQIFNKRSRLSRGFNQYKVEEVWRSCFGEVISSYTTKIFYKDEVLTVYINSSSLKEEIMMNKENILKRLNSELQYKKVVDLKVR